MYRLFFSLAILVIGISSTTSAQEAYFKSNVALVDFRIRSISTNSFVREIIAIDFSGAHGIPDSLGFEGYGFADDGQGYDQMAGDGIYTTANIFPHTESLPYNPEQLVQSVSPNVVTDEEFAWEAALESYLSEYNIHLGPIIRIHCDMYWCRCNTSCGGCIVQWGGTIGCLDCLKVRECQIQIFWN